MGNLIQYIAQEDPEKNRPWQTSVPQNNSCKTKSTILSKPKYTNPNPRRIPAGEIAKSGLEGFGQGVLGGMERGINATLAGNYNNISNKYLGGGYQKGRKRLNSWLNRKIWVNFTNIPIMLLRLVRVGYEIRALT